MVLTAVVVPEFYSEGARRLVTGPIEVSAADGERVATPFGKQDSSMLRLLAESECLVRRAPHAPALVAGDQVEIIRFDYGFSEWLGFSYQALQQLMLSSTKQEV